MSFAFGHQQLSQGLAGLSSLFLCYSSTCMASHVCVKSSCFGLAAFHTLFVLAQPRPEVQGIEDEQPLLSGLLWNRDLWPVSHHSYSSYPVEDLVPWGFAQTWTSKREQTDSSSFSLCAGSWALLTPVKCSANGSREFQGLARYKGILSATATSMRDQTF